MTLDPRLPGRCWALALAVAIVVSAVACSRAHPVPLDQEFYVWQLAWTPRVVEAINRTAPAARRLHILALEVSPTGEVRRASISPDVIRSLHARRTTVVRIDGRFQNLTRALQPIAHLIEDWKVLGLNVDTLEIDFDCGSRQLAAYAQFLRALRARVPHNVALTITALPAWLPSMDLADLVQLADDVVLQVHSVRDPRRGLFNADEAYQWLQQYARVVARPFKVALPAYGSRVEWDAEGRIAGIDSEVPVGRFGSVGAELAADPRDMAQFLKRLSTEAVPGLYGVVWFRMPTAADHRAWSIETFSAVLAGTSLHSSLRADLRAKDPHSASDLILSNAGNLDLPAPAWIRVRGQCPEADAINGYLLERGDRWLQWIPQSPRTLRAMTTINVGWIRCETTKPQLEVDQ